MLTLRAARRMAQVAAAARSPSRHQGKNASAPSALMAIRSSQRRIHATRTLCGDEEDFNQNVSQSLLEELDQSSSSRDLSMSLTESLRLSLSSMTDGDIYSDQSIPAFQQEEEPDYADEEEENIPWWESMVLRDPYGRKSITTTPITEHEERDINRVYMLRPEELSRNFTEGVAGGLDKEFVRHSTRGILVRRQGLEMVDELRQFAATGRSIKQVQILDGVRGCGKSALMTYVVHYARESGWLVLFIPRLSDIISSAKVVQPCQGIEHMFQTDFPHSVSVVLREFVDQHAQQLENIPLKTPIADLACKARVLQKEGMNLLDLCHVGIDYPNFATATYSDLRRELSLVDEFPVLIAVDDYNMLFQKPRIFYEFESIDVTNHAFYNAVADVLPLDEGSIRARLRPERKLKNGTILLATTAKYPESSRMQEKMNCGSLLRKVSPYNKEEMLSIMKFYKRLGLLPYDALDDEVSFWNMKSLVDSNPEKLRQHCEAL